MPAAIAALGDPASVRMLAQTSPCRSGPAGAARPHPRRRADQRLRPRCRTQFW